MVGSSPSRLSKRLVEEKGGRMSRWGNVMVIWLMEIRVVICGLYVFGKGDEGKPLLY